MIDPVGTLITELRTANIASGRVRANEPAAKSDGYEGDALEVGKFKRFVVLSPLGGRRLHRTPVQFVRVGVRAYGATHQDATALLGEISDVLDNAGPRIAGSVKLYQTLDVGGTGEDIDPDTDQPVSGGIIQIISGT